MGRPKGRNKGGFGMCGIATHFRPNNKNQSACGIWSPRIAAYDGRDCNCLRCFKTKAWKTHMGKDKEKKPKA